MGVRGITADFVSKERERWEIWKKKEDGERIKRR
jgi:hypothetical protein